MDDLDEKAIDTAFKIIGLSAIDFDLKSYVIIFNSFLEQFRKYGYIRSLDQIEKYKVDFKAQAENLITHNKGV